VLEICCINDGSLYQRMIRLNFSHICRCSYWILLRGQSHDREMMQWQYLQDVMGGMNEMHEVYGWFRIVDLTTGVFGVYLLCGYVEQDAWLFCALWSRHQNNIVLFMADGGTQFQLVSTYYTTDDQVHPWESLGLHSANDNLASSLELASRDVMSTTTCTVRVLSVVCK